jgi:hypothetical protein
MPVQKNRFIKITIKIFFKRYSLLFVYGKSYNIQRVMLNSIKKYIKKAKEEVSREYMVENTSDSSSEKQEARSWIGVDLDGTLAYYDRSSTYDEVGEPVPAMMPAC